MNRYCRGSCWVVLVALVSVMSDGYGVISAAQGFPMLSRLCAKPIQPR